MTAFVTDPRKGPSGVTPGITVTAFVTDPRCGRPYPRTPQPARPPPRGPTAQAPWAPVLIVRFSQSELTSSRGSKITESAAPPQVTRCARVTVE